MEDAVDVLASGGLGLGDVGRRVAAEHLVDRADHVEHLLPADEPVAVEVVQPEHPLELLLDGAPRDVRQDRQEFLPEKCLDLFLREL